jgi:hypothetical protein
MKSRQQPLKSAAPAPQRAPILLGPSIEPVFEHLQAASEYERNLYKQCTPSQVKKTTPSS